MAQKHTLDNKEYPMTRDGRIQGPSRRYRRLRHPIFLSTEWTAKNPLLQRGEIGAESDTHRLKIGDGVTYWNDLPYTSDSVATWGAITGDISDQTDLQNALADKVDKTSTANKVYGTDNNGDQTTYNITDFGAVDDVKVNNVSVVTSKIANIDLTSYLKNIATATDAISVLGTANTSWTNGINIGKGSRINSTNGVAIGVDASADVNAVGIGRDTDAGTRGTAIGAYAKTSYDTGIAIGCWNSNMNNAVSSAKGAYQFGVGTNSTARTLNIGWYDDSVHPSTFRNYQLLDGNTGLIPDARISTNIARAADIPTVNDATLTIQKNGTNIDTFTANSATNKTVNITVPTTPGDIGAQAALTAGSNIQITGSTISATDTTYSVMTGASAGDAGASGLVPAPAAGDQAKFLQGDGTWATPTAATAWGNITGTLSDQTDLDNALKALVPAGTVLAFSGTTTPAGYLVCDGSAVSRTTYADLFNAIGTYYGDGDGSTTFNLPNFMNGYPLSNGSSSDISVGNVTSSASLPNITGNFNAYTYNMGNPGGAFGSTIQTAKVLNSGSQNNLNINTFSFSAQASSGRYSRTDGLVYPTRNILRGGWIIKY